MRCNAPVERLNVVWLRFQPPLARPGGTVLKGIEVLAGTETFPVTYGRCRHHRVLVSARVVSTLFGTLAAALWLGGLAAVVGATERTMLALFAAGVVCFAVAACASVWPWEARIVDMRSGRAWVKGFGKPYVDELPEYWPGDRPPGAPPLR
jgi:hypothetical protein